MNYLIVPGLNNSSHKHWQNKFVTLERAKPAHSATSIPIQTYVNGNKAVRPSRNFFPISMRPC